MIALARFLSPADFGVYAIVMLFINLVSIFGSAGSAQILIMRREAGVELTNSLFYLNLVIGTAAYLVLLSTSASIASFFGVPDVEALLDIAGLALLLQAPVLVQRALMERELRFSVLVKTETVSVLLAASLGIGSAAMGMGVYSLLVYNLSAIVMTSVGLGFLCNWRPASGPRLSELSDIMLLVFQFTGFTFLNFLTRNADIFLIGRLIGSGPLGLYSMAYRITLYPIQALSQVVHRVAYPTLSNLRETPDSARAFYLRSLQGVTLLSFPALVGLGVTAETLIPVLLGNQWTSMISVVEILACVGLLQTVTATVGTIYPALGETRLMLALGALNFFVVITAFLIGIAFGIQGVALAYLAANAIMFFVQARLAWPLLELGIGSGLATIVPSLFASLLMGVLVMGVGQLGPGYELHEAVVLCLQVAAGVIFYPAIVWLLFRESLSDFLAMLRKA